ncbi:Piso0_000608 [Millerozyma farinosa CBS 7064]|uniref:Piso0_000608 protein n=1 Tax=Pichia sorbitophila (strain ATCC MYA-4447 / BCRC 22081 / CBS 7064 / NBRC 10061 / NRRL Y-12695) TaxID=559304 RepID=G8YPJ9_PICSO|nr:Piso0_000608 [Millerozyma farinosa CBS 7064]
MRCLLLTWLFSIGTIIATVRAASIPVLTPSQDSFYEPPPGYENTTVGTVLKIRKPPHRLRSIYFPMNVKDSWQILVRSSDAKGNPTTIASTIIEPYNADPKKLVSYQTAEDSASPDCAPSYAFLEGASMSTVVTQLESILIQGALDQGWFVVTPDYEGPRAAFTVGLQAGHGTLDSIRGVLNSRNYTGIDKDVKIALWGYSGGSLASGWAAALQPTYAKELKPHLIGVALGGFVTNITATAVSIEGSLFAGLSPAAIAGLCNEYPEIRSLISTELMRKTSFETAFDGCLINTLLHYTLQPIFSGVNRYVKSGWKIFDNPAVQKVINANTLGVRKSQMPDIPLFVYHGVSDTIVPFKNSQQIYEKWCSAGIKSFEFAVDKTTGHISEAVIGSPAALAWLKNRFDGKKVVDGCQRTERVNNLEYPGTNSTIAEIISEAIISIFGGDIGPNGENLAVESSSKGRKLVRRSDVTFSPAV